MSNSSDEAEKTNARDIVRLGAKAFTFQELLQFAEKPWDYGKYLLCSQIQLSSTCTQRDSILTLYIGRHPRIDHRTPLDVKSDA